MRMKFFGREGSKEVLELEEEINAWLARNPAIKVVDVQQCASGGSLHDTKVYISIWYEDA